MTKAFEDFNTRDAIFIYQAMTALVEKLSGEDMHTTADEAKETLEKVARINLLDLPTPEQQAMVQVPVREAARRGW